MYYKMKTDVVVLDKYFRKRAYFLTVLIVINVSAVKTEALWQKFDLKFGHDIKSNRPVLELRDHRSKIECGAACDHLRMCGGFNYRKLTNGKVECQLLQGYSELGDMQSEPSFSYYEITGPVDLNGCKELYDFNDLQETTDLDLVVDGQQITLPVLCDHTSGGGWTVLIKRRDGSVDFNRLWADYRDGFGEIHGEFYIGNAVMHALTSDGRYELRFDMSRFTGETGHAEYDSFLVDSESNKFTVHVGAYTGGVGGDSFSALNGRPFTTRDSDNDVYPLNCAQYTSAGFWYAACTSCGITGVWGRLPAKIYIASLNVDFYPGITWSSWVSITAEKFEKMDMKIRPVT